MTSHHLLSPQNWFEQGGKQYAQFRPEYPPALAAFLAAASNNCRLAIDVGCGSGQLTHQLANHFERVLGIDPSRDQLAHVAKHTATQKYIDYVCASAEALPIANRQASLVVAAQAAHWFELPRFYKEVRRVGMQDAIVALVSYGVMVLDENLNTRFDDFYWNEIGSYWPPERKLVDSGYADLPFPFEELNAPPVAIQKPGRLPNCSATSAHGLP
ncbi:MAG: class I SAM-dependent methyltransferase [Burkholderiaceae bacterium]|nr:class I SAM-dependent methyltransferase [Burkholderiaceae bacterium]